MESVASSDALLRARHLAVPGCAGRVAFSVSAGGAVVVLGPPGAGKSALVDLVTRAEPAREGEIALFGQDLRQARARDRAALRRRLGVIFQDLRLAPELSVAETLALAARAVGRTPLEYAGPAAELLAWVGLAAHARKVVGELDEDRCRRLALARALINAPRLLVADEPAGDLTGVARRRLLGLIGEVQRSGVAVVLASTDETLAARSGAGVVRLARAGAPPLAGAA
jgi:cell division transport system ATP-binding protein